MNILVYGYIFHCVYIYAHASSIYPALPGQYRLKSYRFWPVQAKILPFLAFSHYHGNQFAKLLANVLSWVKTYHHAEFQRNSPTGLARMMVQAYRQTDKFCFFPDMPPGIKPSQSGSPPSLKVWSKSNRGILRNG